MKNEKEPAAKWRAGERRFPAEAMAERKGPSATGRERRPGGLAGGRLAGASREGVAGAPVGGGNGE